MSLTCIVRPRFSFLTILNVEKSAFRTWSKITVLFDLRMRWPKITHTYMCHDISIFQKYTRYCQGKSEFILLHNTTKINIVHRDNDVWYACTYKHSTLPLRVHVCPIQSQTVALDFNIPVHVFTQAVSVYFISSEYTMKQLLLNA